MTLQELHELIGKVLKERPELSTASVEPYHGTIDITLITYDTKYHTILLRYQDEDDEIAFYEEVLWKAN